MAKPITCPFCFTSFTASDIKFRCTHSNCKARTSDTVYAEYQGSPPQQLGAVFSTKISGMDKMRGIFPKKATCPDCNRETFKRVCPTCHYELTQDAGEVEEHIIAVIGGRGTGKSTYIATLIQRLEHEVGRNFNAGVLAKGDNTRRRYERDFYGPLYRDKQLIPPTQVDDITTRAPMVFRITFNSNRQVANLVLFDTAGENMESFDAMTQQTKYILYADGVIFLLDPLQIDAVRDQLQGISSNPLPPRMPNSEPRYIVERLRELYEAQGAVKASQKVDKPIAFTLAKMDVLEPILDPASGPIVHGSGQHLGYLNGPDVQAVNTVIDSHLRTWMGEAFSEKVKQNFNKYAYFGVSPLGREPANGKIDSVAPTRVEDPLLWILGQLGIIKIKK